MMNATFGLDLYFCGKVMHYCEFVVHVHTAQMLTQICVFEPFLHIVQLLRKLLALNTFA